MDAFSAITGAAPPGATPAIVPGAPRPAAPPVSTEQSLPAEHEVRAAAKTLNDTLTKPPLEARYAHDADSGLTVITIVNQNSGEVLRQLPDRAAVEIARAITAKISQLAPNLLDETA